MTPPREASTDQRLLVAVFRLATQHTLPHVADIERAVRAHDHDPLPRLIGSYLAMAELIVESDRRRQGLGWAMLRASDLACTIRSGAQGMRGPAPALPVWSVLVAILTVLTARNRTRAERDALAEQVGALALSLGEL